MNKEETQRQKKVAGQIQKDMSDILLKNFRGQFAGAMVTVTNVRMSPDLGLAKIYLSVFPFDRRDEAMKVVVSAASMIRGEIGRRVKNQLRIVPEVAFFLDDSMEYVENLDRLIKM